MRWEAAALDEMQERIGQMGLDACKVCGSGLMKVWRLPTTETIGGFGHERGHPRYDPESNSLFMVHVECDACGYAMYFNSETLLPNATRSLVVGSIQPDED